MTKIIGAILAIAAIVGGYFFFTKKAQAGNVAEKTQYKIFKLESGMVKKTVSATGTLQPWTFVDIKSKAGGRVDALLVEVGSVVKKDQILARIDPSDTLLSVDTARADIDSARVREKQSEQQYKLQIMQSELAVKTAEASLRASKANLQAAQARYSTALQQRDAQPELTRATIASAQANYENSLKVLREMQVATHPQERAAAKSAFDQAIANEKNAKINLSRQKSLMDKGFVSAQVVDQAEASYDVARAQVETAKRKLDTIKEEQTAGEDAAQARVNQAKAQLDNAKAAQVDVKLREAGLKEAEASVKQFENQVTNAESALELAKANRANNEIRKFDIASAKAGIASVKARVVNAENTLEQTTVRAPTAGVILQKYVEQGTIITSGMSISSTGTSIVQIGDVSRMYVNVTVDETDIANVILGQNVDVLIEAYPGIPFEGKVTRIDPQATVEQNVTTVRVRVEIDNEASAFRLLKPGMNATCEFVIDKKDGVIKVPSEALRTDDNGKYVEIAQGGKPAPADPKTGSSPGPDTLVDVKVVKQKVTTGLEGNEDIEILEGLKGDETIIRQKIEPTPTQAGSPFGGGGGGRPGGFGGGGGGRGGGR